METTENSLSHNLIPEKEASFSGTPGLYFDQYLEQFTSHLDASVQEIKAWEDETVLLSLQRKKVVLSTLDRQKLLAFKNFNSKACYISTPLEFSNIATLLNEDIPITDSLDTIEPAYVAWAIEVLEKHDSNHEIELTDEVAMYVAMCFYEEGFLHMPKNLDIFNSYLENLNTDTPSKEEANEKIKRVDDYLESKRKETTS